MKGQLEIGATLDALDVLDIFSNSDGHDDDDHAGPFKYWLLETPDPHEHHEDNPWADFHLFNDEWIQVQNRLEWYESPNVPDIYKNHKYLFKQNMEMSGGRPEEVYYEENASSGEFASTMYITDDLPSGFNGEMRIKTEIGTKSPPSGENDFALVEYNVDTEMKYSGVPKGITFLPRILARPMNRMMKWLFFLFIGEEIVDRDGEYAIERTNEYFQYLRKYHGEEPSQAKSRQAEFTPLPDDGIFFE
ncbi:MAG: hypothetical protein ABEJ03_02775 [Candidatus Nanohaloarchaea archaeon]